MARWFEAATFQSVAEKKQFSYQKDNIHGKSTPRRDHPFQTFSSSPYIHTRSACMYLVHDVLRLKVMKPIYWIASGSAIIPGLLLFFLNEPSKIVRVPIDIAENTPVGHRQEKKRGKNKEDYCRFWNYKQLLYWTHYHLETFWCPNFRYNGSHLTLCKRIVWAFWILTLLYIIKL